MPSKERIPLGNQVPKNFLIYSIVHLSAEIVLAGAYAIDTERVSDIVTGETNLEIGKPKQQPTRFHAARMWPCPQRMMGRIE
jgi:hypothetical protein